MPAKKRFIVNSNRPPNPNHHFSNIYSKYKWTLSAISANISHQNICPIFEPSPDKTDTSNIMCDICYNYYPEINQTNCCSHPICTECFAAAVDPKDLICPFCRTPHLTLTPNLKNENLKTNDVDDEAYTKYEKKFKDGFDFDEAEGCSDDAIAIALQFQTNVKDIDKLIKAGVSPEDIILSLTQPKQGSNIKDDIRNYIVNEDSNEIPIDSNQTKSPPMSEFQFPPNIEQEAVFMPQIYPNVIQDANLNSSSMVNQVPIQQTSDLPSNQTTVNQIPPQDTIDFNNSISNVENQNLQSQNEPTNNSVETQTNKRKSFFDSDHDISSDSDITILPS